MSSLKSWKSLVDNVKYELAGYKKEHNAVGYVEEDKFPSYFSRGPLYFRDCQNVGNGIYFANYYAWMGKIRESAMSIILKDIAADFATGEIGMVTNSSTVKIVSDATVGDILETRFGLMDIINDSTLDLFFVWKKLLDDGSYEDVAYGEMRVSWVTIVSHGVVKPRPLPPYYTDFLEKIKAPDKLLPYTHKMEKGRFDSLVKGENIYTAPLSPRRGKLLFEETISTTLEDGNSVGNIYFSNYGRWQGLVRDNFFHSINGSYFQGIGDKGELIAVDTEVSHLREIMPFDTILVTMNIVAIWENAAELSFAYFKIDKDEKIKLATGSQRVVWAKSNQDSIEALPWPKEYLAALKKDI